MKLITLKRVTFNSECTQGVMIDDEMAFCITQELPWKDNLPDVSCIPPGKYQCSWGADSEGREVVHVHNVKNRAGINIHTGNFPSEIQGCIEVGEMFEPIDGKTAVKASGKAFKELKSRTDQTFFTLEIMQC